jgi:WD40 repeat protein
MAGPESLTTNDCQRREDIAARFENAWRAGQRPSLDDFLPADGPERLPLLLELAHLDLAFRLKAGEPAGAREYLERYPELAGDPKGVVGLVEAGYRLRQAQELRPDQWHPAGSAQTVGGESAMLPPAGSASSFSTGPTTPGPTANPSPSTGSGHADDLPQMPGAEVFGVLGRTMKWARRHPALAGLHGVLALALTTGFLGMTALYRQAERQRDVADVAKADAERQRYLAEGQRDLTQHNLYAAHLNLAQNAWQTANAARVLELLDQQRPSPWQRDLRGFEWHYLHRLCHCALLTAKGHTGQVNSMASRHDRKLLATGRNDPMVKVWDTSPGQEFYSLQGHTGPIWSVAFSPDGRRLASGSYDKSVKVWNAADGRQLLSLSGHTEQVTSVAFSPDGRRLASASYDKTIRIWDAVDGRLLHSLKGHSRWVTSVAFSPDSQRLVSGSGDNTIKVWDVANGSQCLSIKAHAGWVNSVAFSPDGRCLASGSHDKTIGIWDAASGRGLFRLKGHTEAIRSVAYSPDGRYLASGSEDKTIKIWDTDGLDLFSLKRHAHYVMSVAISPDSRRVASAAADDTVRLWDIPGGRELLSCKGYDHWLRGVAFSPDGHRLASCGDDGTITIRDGTPFEGPAAPTAPVR